MDTFEQVDQIIASLDRPRKQALERYLASPFFQINPDVSHILNKWNKRESNTGHEKNLRKALGNPSAALLRQALDVVLQFIRQYEFDQLSTLKANANLAGIRRNNIEKLYKDTVANVEKLPETEFDQSSEFFFYRSLIEKNIFELKTENEKKNAKVKIASELNMHKISENVDIFYILEMLKNALISYVDDPGSWKEIDQLPEIQFSLEAGKLYENQVPVIAIYRQLWLMSGMQKTEAKLLQQWEKTLDQIRHKIPDVELEIINEAARMIKTS